MIRSLEDAFCKVFCDFDLFGQRVRVADDIHVRGGAAQRSAARPVLDKDRMGDDCFECALKAELNVFVWFWRYRADAVAACARGMGTKARPSAWTRKG